MTNSAHFLLKKRVFQGKHVPEDGFVTGYAAIIEKYQLSMPMPSPMALVCEQNKSAVLEEWLVLPPSYLPTDNSEIDEVEALYKQLVFALKYEGVNLLVFSLLTTKLSTEQLTQLVNFEPTGQYSRRIWFLMEWILGAELPAKEPLSKKSYVPLLDEKLQYAVSGKKSARHLILNNLPGTVNFCPLIRKTPKLEAYIQSELNHKNQKFLTGIRKEIIQRASAFLLLKDSKASFSIEGESPKSKRAARWGEAIRQAGIRELDTSELERLQQVVIENSRFLKMGFRKKGGFVGEHDRSTGEPIPDHISAKWQDLPALIEGLIETNKLLIDSDIDAVLSAAIVAFGFVFIHPFADGNGRIHRYLIHHILARKEFSQQGIVFPVSASILDRIADYQKVLQRHSHPLLDFIDWKETKNHNIKVLNETLNLYRYFDATSQAEFLYDCVQDTIDNIIPAEIRYLTQFDAFKKAIDNEFEMPNSMVALLVRLLEQNEGKLSKKVQQRDFAALQAHEIATIEELYNEAFT